LESSLWMGGERVLVTPIPVVSKVIVKSRRILHDPICIGHLAIEHGDERIGMGQRRIGRMDHDPEQSKKIAAAERPARVRLGGFRGRAGTAADCAKAREARTKKAASRAADLAPLIGDIQAKGAKSLRSIARELNAPGISAPRGGTWLAPQVASVLAR